MEAAALYYLAQHHVDALAIMTISDSLVNPDEDTTHEERQNTFTDMMKVGLETFDCRLMAKFFHDEWLYDLQNYHYSRALRSIKQQEEVPDLLVSLLQLMAERRELNIQPS